MNNRNENAYHLIMHSGHQWRKYWNGKKLGDGNEECGSNMGINVDSRGMDPCR